MRALYCDPVSRPHRYGATGREYEKEKRAEMRGLYGDPVNSPRRYGATVEDQNSSQSEQKIIMFGSLYVAMFTVLFYALLNVLLTLKQCTMKLTLMNLLLYKG